MRCGRRTTTTSASTSRRTRLYSPSAALLMFRTRSRTSPLCGQVYGNIFQTATTVYELVAQKKYGLHMEANKKIAVVGHSLGGKVAVFFLVKLVGEELRLFIGPNAYQTCRC